MKFRYLGKTGLLVSELTLGTMTFGAKGWGCDKTEAHAILAAYLEAGGNLIDTADVYAAGETESIIGEFLLSVDRSSLIIASKCGFPFGSDVNGLGLSRRHIILSVEASLKRLGTDYLDIFYLHRPDPCTPPDEILEAFATLIQQGKVLYPAFSNIQAWRLTLLQSEAKARKMAGFACGQLMYNLVDRNCEQEIIPAMMYQGIGFLAWSPLAGGLLTGKYRNFEEVPKGSRFDLRRNLDIPRFWNDRSRQIVKEFIALSEEVEISPSKLAIGWLLSKDYISSVILGARTKDQLMTSLAAADFSVPEDILARLDTISEPARNYLWDFSIDLGKTFGSRGRVSPGTIL